MSSNEQFCKKYYPSKMADFIGRGTQIEIIKKWLSSYTSNKTIALNNLKKSKKPRKVKKIIEIDEENESEDEFNEIIVPKNNKHENRSCMLINGPHGSGKTSLTLTILREMGYEPNLINLTKNVAGKGKSILENVDKILKGNDIYDQMNSKIINNC